MASVCVREKHYTTLPRLTGFVPMLSIWYLSSQLPESCYYYYYYYFTSEFLALLEGTLKA